jgi:glycine dehydrogenase
VTLDLTGMDIASASLLDEATAAAEAMAMAKRVSKLKNANRFFVAADVHPQTLDVVRTRAETFGFDVIVDDADKVLDHQDVFGVLLQQVGTTEVHDYGALIAELKSRKVVVSVAADFMALVLLTAPGKQGADIVFGSAQRFGVPMGYGGPHAAFFGAKDEFKRSMPAVLSASQKTLPVTPRCAWRCRPASSISAARKRTPTSVPHRCCWQTSPACTPCSTARLA